MKIMHIALASHFTEGMTYQDNILPKINAQDGNEVLYVADPYTFKNGKLVKTSEEDKILDDGFRLIRIDYDFILTDLISEKIKKASKLKKILVDFNPDVILFHNAVGFELMTVSKYVKEHKETLFYVDSHSDFNNSSTNLISFIFNKLVHGFFLKMALKQIDKILYVADSCKEYLQKMYHIKEDKLVYFPLGGLVTDLQQQEEEKTVLINQFHLPHDSIILLHSGKMTKEKKTIELLNAFKKVSSARFRLFIFGAVDNEIKIDFDKIIAEDNRICFLGWKSGNEITSLLNAGDIYCQPGTPSATSQMALCCGCAEVVAPNGIYERMYGSSVMYADKEESIISCLEALSNPDVLADYKQRAYQKAITDFDYRMLARKYLK